MGARPEPDPMASWRRTGAEVGTADPADAIALTVNRRIDVLPSVAAPGPGSMGELFKLNPQSA